MLERRSAPPGLRVASLILAVLAHLCVLALLLVPAFLPRVPVTEAPVEISLRWPTAPRLGGGAGGAEGVATRTAPRPSPAPLATADLVEPQAIPDETPAAAPLGASSDSSLASSEGAGGAPAGPGSPAGDPRSTCLENCEEGGLPGGFNPVPRELRVTPVPLHQPRPRYPLHARDLGMTGAVTVEIVVGTDGRVQSARLVEGRPPFDLPTLEAVKSWRYAPVLHEGKPIVWKSTITVHFRLD